MVTHQQVVQIDNKAVRAIHEVWQVDRGGRGDGTAAVPASGGAVARVGRGGVVMAVTYYFQSKHDGIVSCQVEMDEG